MKNAQLQKRILSERELKEGTADSRGCPPWTRTEGWGAAAGGRGVTPTPTHTAIAFLVEEVQGQSRAREQEWKVCERKSSLQGGRESASAEKWLGHLHPLPGHRRRQPLLGTDHRVWRTEMSGAEVETHMHTHRHTHTHNAWQCPGRGSGG